MKTILIVYLIARILFSGKRRVKAFQGDYLKYCEFMIKGIKSQKYSIESANIFTVHITTIVLRILITVITILDISLIITLISKYNG